MGDRLDFKLYNEFGMLVQTKQMINGVLHFDNLDTQIQVPKNDTTFVTIKADARNITMVNETGKRLRLALDADSTLNGGISYNFV